MSRQHEQDEHDEAARAEKSAVDEVFAELRRESQAHAKDLVDLDHAELRLAFETFAMRLSRHGVVVPSIHGPAMIIRVVDLYLLDITDRLARQVKLRVRAEQRAREAESRVADLQLELLGASHQHEKAKAELMAALTDLGEACDSREHLERELTRLRGLLAADPQGDGQAERARVALDDIRCDILNAGWPLGDDADQELTPRRLVREVLAEVSSLRARLLDDAQAAARVQHGLHARAVAAESALARLLAAPAPAPALSPAAPEDQASVEPGAVTASESAPVSTAPKTDAPASWLLAPALERQLPPFLQNLSIVEVYASKDALCVSPSGWYWMATSNEVRGRLEVSVHSATRRGEIIPNGEFFSTLFPAPWSPVFVRNPSVAEPVAAPTAWRLSPAFISRLPAHLRGLTVVRTWLSQVTTPLAERDAVCVAPNGMHWLVRHEPSRDGAHGPTPASREVAKASRMEIKILRCDAWGRRRSENYHILFPVGELPILEPIVTKAPEPAPTSPPVSAPTPSASPSAAWPLLAAGACLIGAMHATKGASASRVVRATGDLLTLLAAGQSAQAALASEAPALPPISTPSPAPPADPSAELLATPPAARRWRLTSALLECLPEALQHLKVLQRCPSPDPGIEADAICVAPDGAQWVVLHEDFIEGELDAPNRQVIWVRRCSVVMRTDEHGKPIPDGEFHYVVSLSEDQLPVVVPDEDPVLPG